MIKKLPLIKIIKKNRTITFNVDTDLESPTQNNVQSRLRPPLTSTGLRPTVPTVPFSINHDEFGIQPAKLNFNQDLNLDNNTAESVIENSIINSKASNNISLKESSTSTDSKSSNNSSIKESIANIVTKIKNICKEHIFRYIHTYVYWNICE